MNRMKKQLLFLTTLLLFFTNLKADGTLIDGQSTFEWRTFSQGNADWELDASGVDQAFQLWFWYRINAQANETVLPAPDSETFAGNTATLNWANVNGLGFDITVTAVLTDSPGNSAGLALNSVITNNTGSTLNFELFQYMDLDKGQSFNGDEAQLVGTNTIEITDVITGDMCQFNGIGATAYQVINFAGLLNTLGDGAISTLDNTGLPFGPGDWTGAFQWSLSIEPGGSATIDSGSGGNEPAPIPAVVAKIPTMNQWGLLIFGLLILNVSISFIRRVELG